MKHSITEKQIEKIENITREIRIDLIRMLSNAGSGHSAGSLGMADIFAALYFHILNHDAKKPNNPNRDRLFLSNGHIAPVWYATLARASYLSNEEAVSSLRKLGSRLQGHPERKSLFPIEAPSGPLGQGISQAVGYAYGANMDKKTFDVYCVMGDGELQEGQCYEAFMFAGAKKLQNLTVIIDRNYIQLSGDTEDIMPIEPLREKLESFKFHVIEIDGHNIREISDACFQAKSIYNKPVAIIAYTIPGKGVSYMEHKYEWHGRVPKTKEEIETAINELSR